MVNKYRMKKRGGRLIDAVISVLIFAARNINPVD